MCCLSLCVFVLVSAPRPRFPPLGPVLAPRPQRHLAEDSARAILPRACSFRERSKRQLQCLEFSNISANFVFSSNARNTRACVSNLVSSSFAKHFYRHSLFLSFIASRYLSFSLSLSPPCQTSVVYQLQRRVRTLREQLQRRDLHLDLLRRKLSLQEESVKMRSLLQNERDEACLRYVHSFRHST